MTVQLPYPPVELDPSWIAPKEPIEEAILPRRPRVGEWVNGFHATPNGPSSYRRGQKMVLARVHDLREGNYNAGGVIAEPWNRERLIFNDLVFIPWCCVNSRVAVNHYSLTC